MMLALVSAVNVSPPSFPKARFPLGEFVCANRKKVLTVSACSRRIFSPTNVNESRCRILIFASHCANKVAK